MLQTVRLFPFELDNSTLLMIMLSNAQYFKGADEEK